MAKIKVDPTKAPAEEPKKAKAKAKAPSSGVKREKKEKKVDTSWLIEKASEVVYFDVVPTRIDGKKMFCVSGFNIYGQACLSVGNWQNDPVTRSRENVCLIGDLPKYDDWDYGGTGYLWSDPEMAQKATEVICAYWNEVAPDCYKSPIPVTTVGKPETPTLETANSD